MGYIGEHWIKTDFGQIELERHSTEDYIRITVESGDGMEAMYFIDSDQAQELADGLQDVLNKMRENWRKREEEHKAWLSKVDRSRNPYTCSHMTENLNCTIHDISMRYCHDACYSCEHFDGEREEE